VAVVEGVREGEAVTEGLPLEAPEEEREAARRGEGVAPVWGLAVAPAAWEKEGAVEREGAVEGEVIACGTVAPACSVTTATFVSMFFC
jgi:hypothetical protein